MRKAPLLNSKGLSGLYINNSLKLSSNSDTVKIFRSLNYLIFKFLQIFFYNTLQF